MARSQGFRVRVWSLGLEVKVQGSRATSQGFRVRVRVRSLGIGFEG
jgi:ribosomal protein L34